MSDTIGEEVATMHVTVEAIIEPSGAVRILQPIDIRNARRALVTILDEPAAVSAESELMLFSDSALAEDWLRPEEDEAWSYLQSEQS
jgi:hypothetical protein